jgi:hypothetical protein
MSLVECSQRAIVGHGHGCGLAVVDDSRRWFHLYGRQLGWEAIPHEGERAVVERVVCGGSSIPCRTDVLAHTVNYRDYRVVAWGDRQDRQECTGAGCDSYSMGEDHACAGGFLVSVELGHVGEIRVGEFSEAVHALSVQS